MARQNGHDIFNRLVTQTEAPLQFPGDPAVRVAFGNVAEAVLVGLAAVPVSLNGAAQQLLVRKLAHHVVNTGQANELGLKNAKAEADVIAAAVAMKPSRLQSHSLKAILDIHRQTLATENRRVTPFLQAVPRPLLYEETRYQLYELTTPLHVLEVGGLMNNCLSTRFQKEALRVKGLKTEDPASAYYLSYAMKLRRKECRLFSLEKREEPIYLIRLNPKTGHIDELEHYRQKTKIEAEQFGFPVLLRALAHIDKAVMPLGRIASLPLPPAGSCYSPRHGLQETAKTPLSERLVWAVEGEELSAADFRAAVENPRVTLRLQRQQDLDRLPPRVAATVHFSKGPYFSAPQVEEFGNLHLYTANVSLEARHTGDIIHPGTGELDLPNVEQVGVVTTFGHSLYAPRLRRAIFIRGDHVKNIDLSAAPRSLQHSMNVAQDSRRLDERLATLQAAARMAHRGGEFRF